MRRIVIIGGGPAGSTAALFLGRAGFDVTLVEQARMPRDKVCGECLSSTGIDVLARLDVRAAAFEPFRPIELHRTLIFSRCGTRSEVVLPRPMWGISRARLDQTLLSLAAKHCRVMQPARCEAINAAEVGSHAVVRDLTENQTTTIPFDLLLLADGKGGLIGRSQPVTGDLGIKSHWTRVDAPADAIQLFAVDGHYGGIAPIEDGRYNVSFSVPAARVRAFRGDLDGLFASATAENAELSRQLRGGGRLGPWHASPLPRFGVAGRWPARVIPLGNAAAALEPIGGEGMGLAMRSAQIAAEAVIAANGDGRGVDFAAVRRAFGAIWRTRRAACRLSARLISSARFSQPAIRVLNAAPLLGRAAMALIGK